MNASTSPSTSQPGRPRAAAGGASAQDPRFLPSSPAMSVLNPVVGRLTLRTVAAPRRAVPLAVLVILALGLSTLVAFATDRGAQTAVAHVDLIVLGLMVPLIGLIIGTACLGPAIEDGSIIYFLAKPLRRSVVARSAVAACAALALAIAVPLTAAASVIMGGLDGDGARVAVAFTLVAAVSTITYTTVFALLSAMTRNGVLYGLIYALVWETTVGGYVPGAKTLSIRQWSLALGEKVLGPDRAATLNVDAAVGPVLGGLLLLATVVASLWLLGRRLDRVRVGGDD